jgi:PKD repeat protein
MYIPLPELLRSCFSSLQTLKKGRIISLLFTGVILSSAMGSSAQVTSYPYSEGWEGGGIGSWTQSSADDFDWENESGGTTSNSTGPGSANQGSQYIYTETSPQSSGDVAIIENDFDFSGVPNPEITFDYHMYFDGDPNGGTLELDVSTDGGSTWTNLWSRSGDQGNQWNQASVSLSSYGNSSVKLRYRFEVGTNTFSFENDCALDLIEVENIPKNDIAANSVISPSTQCAFPGGDSVEVEYLSQGTQTLTQGTSFDVSYTFQGNTVTETHTVQSDVKRGETFTHKFNKKVNPNQDNQNYQIQAAVNWSQDGKSANDNVTVNFRNEYSPPQPSSVTGDTICNGGKANLKLDNPLNQTSTNYVWYDKRKGGKEVGSGDQITTSSINSATPSDSFYVERIDSLPVPLKLSEVKQDGDPGVEIQHLVNQTKDYSGYTVAVYEGSNRFGFTDKITWDLGKFGPYEAKSGREGGKFNSGLNPFDDIAALIVGPNGNVVDFMAAFDDDALQDIDYQVNGFNITFSDLQWEGSPQGNSSSDDGFRRVGSKDNNDAGDWKVEGLSPGKINAQLDVKNFELASTCPSMAKGVGVKVNPVPEPGFESTPDTICATRNVSFNDTTTVKFGSPSYNYDWDIGDKNFTRPNAQLAFPQSEGSYYVKLAVETQKGCADSISTQVQVNAKPDPNFGSVEVCDGNATVLPDSTSFIGTGDLNYEWQVQGTTYTSANPTHTFNSSASNQVQLAVTSDMGCGDTITKPVNILPTPDAQFSVNDGCRNDTLTFQNNTSFSGGSVSNLQLSWDFGDGDGVTGTNAPSHSYNTKGTYNPELVAVSSEGCQDVANQQVEINAVPEPDFTFENTCEPKAVELTNNTQFNGDNNNLDYTWDLEGNSVNVKEATYTFSSANTFDVKLEATNTNGNCADSITQSVDVKAQPTADFSVNDGCAGQAVSFNYTGNNPSPSYNWDLGTTTSTMENPAVTYNKPGSYDVSLTVDYYNGRCSMDTTQTLEVNPVPTADFMFGKEGAVCKGTDVQLMNKTSFENGSLSNLSYEWTVGSKNPSGESPTVTFDETGSIDVALTASTNEGCESAVSDVKFVNELPVSDFTLNKMGADAVSLSAQDNTYPTYRWSLGDSATASRPSLTHTYDSNGTYDIELFVKNRAGCTSTSSQEFVLETVGFGNQSAAANSTIEAYPNPFQDVARVKYDVEQRADVQVDVYTASGKNLISETYNNRPAGSYSFNLNAEQGPSSGGAYMIRLQIGDEVYTKQLIRNQ